MKYLGQHNLPLSRVFATLLHQSTAVSTTEALLLATCVM